MALILPPEEMTIEQLEARCRFHTAAAEMYDSQREPAEAKKFRELAAEYSAELERRAAKLLAFSPTGGRR